jgi:hypothetical protein
MRLRCARCLSTREGRDRMRASASTINVSSRRATLEHAPASLRVSLKETPRHASARKASACQTDEPVVCSACSDENHSSDGAAPRYFTDRTVRAFDGGG